MVHLPHVLLVLLASSFLSTSECATAVRLTRFVSTRACVRCATQPPRPESHFFSAEPSEITALAPPAAPKLVRIRSALRVGAAKARKWATALATAGLFIAATSRPAFAARVKPAPPPPVEERGVVEFGFTSDPRELTPSEKAICSVISAAAMGGLLWWGWSSGNEEEREESKRIKKETERLNKVREEFLLEDTEVVKDDDLFSSLRKRMEQGGGEGDGSPSDDLPPSPPSAGLDSPPPKPKPSPPPAPTAQGPTAPPRKRRPITPKPAEPKASRPAGPPAPTPDEPVEDAAVRDADIERLKRMFGN